MFGLGATELIIIFLIILVIFGAKKLPEIGSGLGKGITNFKKAMKDQESLGEKSSSEEKTKE
jgi:sec-independent protein translocase protein TatA